VALEAVGGATIQLTATTPRALAVQNVPHVRVKGFRFREVKAREFSAYVTISGACAGVVLEDLRLAKTTGITRGILLQKLSHGPGDPPVVVRRCLIEGGERCDAGILVAGPPGAGPGTSGLVLRENRITGAVRGIHLLAAVSDCQVVGNLIWNCSQEGLGLEDLPAGCRGILLANNTIWECQCNLRVWDNPPKEKYEPGQVQVRNNLLFDATVGDVMFFLPDQFGGTGKAFPADGGFLIERWRFGHNWRDQAGAQANVVVPLAPADRKLADPDLMSRTPDDADFVRPRKDSPLVGGGAGGQDSSLPVYVGAVPPEGVRPWDWEQTWRPRDRSEKTAPEAGTR
jgi:hypothetical protein